jgi:hypothetical protein
MRYIVGEYSVRYDMYSIKIFVGVNLCMNIHTSNISGHGPVERQAPGRKPT